MMDLILWRHAEAEDWPEDDPQGSRGLERSLTPRGEKQAARMANWLDRQLPEGARIVVSPARRCEQGGTRSWKLQWLDRASFLSKLYCIEILFGK